MESESIDRFADVARAFSAWAEARSTSDPRTEALRARVHLANLIAAVISLPDGVFDAETPDIPQEEYQRIYRRFGTLPFNYYSECFDPLVVPPEEPVVADLADDLADIWRDLKAGIILYDRGLHQDAAWHWTNHYSFHWGHHATSALYAVQSWFSANGDDESDRGG
jgi:hypothetical protein